MTGAVGIAGSGKIARAILRRLQANGVRASGFGVSGPDDQHASKDGAHEVETLIAVPGDIGELEALLFSGADVTGLVPKRGTIVIAATLSPRYVKALRGRIDRAVALIDAPCSGTPRAAEEGRLSFFLGGEETEIAQIRPLLDLLGTRTTRMGGYGTATAAKVLNDFLAASSTALTRIAFDWAEAQGIEEDRILHLAETAVIPARIGDGRDLAGTNPLAATGGEGVSALMESVEMALDLALAEAHLQPPQAILNPCRGQRLRALH